MASKSHSRKTWIRLSAIIIIVLVGGGYGTYFITGVITESQIGDVERINFPEMTPILKDTVVQFEDFVGSEACASCHEDIYRKWEVSTHGKAGGSPHSVDIIGKFDGKERKFIDGLVTPYIDADSNYMFSLKVDGLPDQTFKVEAVVGGGHMIGGGTQTFFTEFPDGTVRFLPFDFHRDGQVWFGETTSNGWQPISEDRKIDKIREYSPSRTLGLLPTNKNCQECHGSQIQLRYDEEKKKYETKYKSLTINCESCHSSGKEHVRIMGLANWESLDDIGMSSLATTTKDESLDVCFRCHALKDPLQPGFLPGKDLEAYYALKYPIGTSSPYHPDGRIREFGYQQNHLSSDCYVNGSMTCVDCHDPHSQKYRDINWIELADPFDDGQCTSCHASKALNPEAHSFHKSNSPGNKCVSCHMPYLQQQATGKDLRFARSDHVIPIPRPGYDASIGIESACYQCHKDKSTDWLQAKTEEWYGELKPQNKAIINVDHFKESMDISEAGELLLDGTTKHAMGQMEGLSRFSKYYLTPDMEGLDADLVDKLKGYIEGLDVDLKSFAMASLHLAADNDPEIHNYLAEQLGDMGRVEESKVRSRWAHTMPFFASKFEKNGDFESAIKINLKALEVEPDNAPILLNVAMLYANLEDFDNAIKYYSESIRADGSNALAWLNLAIALQQKGDSKALSFYLKAVEVDPWNYYAHMSLGKFYDYSSNVPLAINSYIKAIEIDPRISVTYFYLASDYMELRNYDQAIFTANAGLKLNPDDEGGKRMLADMQAIIRRNSN